MDHSRKIIRQAAVGLLKAGGIDAAEQVFDSGDFTLQNPATPAMYRALISIKREWSQ